MLKSSEKRVELEILNSSGRRVSSIDKEKIDIFNKAAYWDGKDDKNKSVKTGVYYIVLKIDGKIIKNSTKVITVVH